MLEKLFPVAVVLGMSFVVGALLALSLRSALRVMSPTSENTSILLLALIAAGAALAAHFGGSAPLAALIGGMLLKQLNPRPWAWPRQLGTAASLLTMLMFVLVSIVAAQGRLEPAGGQRGAGPDRWRAASPRSPAWPSANPGSGASWKQAFWVGCAMSPLSSIALLIGLAVRHRLAAAGRADRQIALPAILLMEVLGAVHRHRRHPPRRRKLQALGARGAFLHRDGRAAWISASTGCRCSEPAEPIVRWSPSTSRRRCRSASSSSCSWSTPTTTTSRPMPRTCCG